MCRVRLRLGQHGDTRLVEAPDLARVAAKRLQRRVLERVEARPKASARAEVRNAALGADARAGQDDAGLPPPDQLGELQREHPPIIGGLDETWSVPPGRAVRPDDEQGSAKPS